MRIDRNGGMRTTLTIDDDVLGAARNLSQARSESIGKAISDLARLGLNATQRICKKRVDSGFPVFSVPRGAHPITLEDVRKAEDEP